jgi:hypothetical protein
LPLREHSAYSLDLISAEYLRELLAGRGYRLKVKMSADEMIAALERLSGGKLKVIEH